jgi:hypothetical protein
LVREELLNDSFSVGNALEDRVAGNKVCGGGHEGVFGITDDSDEIFDGGPQGVFGIVDGPAEACGCEPHTDLGGVETTAAAVVQLVDTGFLSI